MPVYIVLRNSMDRRSCFGCNSPHGTKELKISNQTSYLCPSCARYLRQLLEEDE